VTAATVLGDTVPSGVGAGRGGGRRTGRGADRPADRLERDLRRMAVLQRRAVLARLRRRRGPAGLAHLRA
jgi:hypothetical protein